MGLYLRNTRKNLTVLTYILSSCVITYDAPSAWTSTPPSMPPSTSLIVVLVIRHRYSFCRRRSLSSFSTSLTYSRRHRRRLCRCHCHQLLSNCVIFHSDKFVDVVQAINVCVIVAYSPRPICHSTKRCCCCIVRRRRRRQRREEEGDERSIPS